MSALTVLSGTAAYAGTSHGGDWHHKDPGDATIHNGGDAKAKINQKSWVETAQLALSNTGGNESLAIDANVNLGEQNCGSSGHGRDGGYEIQSRDEHSDHHDGGGCDNKATQENDGEADAPITTGKAKATNWASTRVSQNNSGDSTVNDSASDNTQDPHHGGDAKISNGGDAHLYVDQHAGVGTYQAAAANTGFNSSAAVNIGVNAGAQSGGSGCGCSYGHKGGSSGSNDATQTNNGTANAAITTGDATASNSSKTTVNQTNSGSASSTNTADGNTQGAD